ncbi:MAG: hypothetical protein NTV54_15165 [Ignavibacteriales bacterium]|nr:hypothetical protein [Ignavibacteriales bacterium]
MSGNDFTSFGSMMDSQSIQLPPNSRLGNIIKQSAVPTEQVHSHAQAAMEQDKPRIVLHRNGDQIVRIEFICHCGRTSEIVLEYDGE